MKAVLQPLFFREDKTERFERQLAALKILLAEVAEFLPPRALGDEIGQADAVVFPEILGEAYRRSKDFQSLPVPILVATSEFGTFSMWDWEIMNYLKGKGVAALAPYNLAQALAYCRMLAAKRRLGESKFLIFQDNPGDGFQPEIFKCFYWWEQEATDRLRDKFGISVEKRSLKKLGAKAETYSDADALAEWNKWKYPVNDNFTTAMAVNAAKLYLALRDEIDSENIIGMGTNCLNESRSCRSTPCVAWDRLLEERGILWACEGDTISLATICLLSLSLERPLMMTNIYPFLMGDAATKHEKIPGFPEFLDQPENHILLAHCGYFGLVPRRFSSSWIIREKCLAIVNPDSHVFDARLPEGDVTLVKLDATLDKIMSGPAKLKGYVQYDKSSDCRNGGIVEVGDGKRFMDQVYSHHLVVVEGDITDELRALGKVMGLEVEPV